MSIQSKQIIIVIGLLAVFLFGTFCLVFFYEQEIQVPNTWDKSVKRYDNPITGTVRIVDVENGVTLFRYRDESLVNPIEIKKTSNGRWEVVFVKSP